MQPFETQALHPARRTPRDPRHEVEGAAYAQRHGDRQLGAVAVDPEILFGVTVGDQQNVGLRALQPAHDGWPVGVVRAAAVRAHDEEARIAPSQHLGRAPGHAGRRAQQENAPAAPAARSAIR